MCVSLLLLTLLLIFIRPNGECFYSPAECDGAKYEEGDVVSFDFDFFSKKQTPMNPIITRKRLDVSWENVVADFIRNNSSQGK